MNQDSLDNVDLYNRWVPAGTLVGLGVGYLLGDIITWGFIGFGVGGIAAKVIGHYRAKERSDD